MKFIADFHIHSKYSRATSKDMDLEHLDEWAKIKGIRVLGTGDFTHPLWLEELKTKLEFSENGLLRIKNSDSPTHFILTSEISCIYSKKGRVRKIHLVVFAPSFDAVEKVNAQLGWIGNLKADGRPILGMDAKELLKLVLNVSEECLVVPAHIWTPWFSLFGSRSGFDSIEECFDDYSKYIYSGETGLSSDPKMNWRLSALDKITLISSSDAHSPQNIGREANVFDAGLDYREIIKAIKEKNKQKFLYTIEFFPEEGKYHYDGHRSCQIVLSPKETKKYNGLCPVCHRPLTIGVLNRVGELADREEGFLPENAIPFKSLIPLKEIIAEALGIGKDSKEVFREYKKLITQFGNEFKVLIDIGENQLRDFTLPEIAEGILKVRRGEVFISPGYDGVYGKISILKEGEGREPVSQKTLF